MRSTASNPGRALTGEVGGTTTRRSTAGGGTGGVTRPSLANVPGRDKKSSGSGDRQGVGGGGWAGYRKAREERSDKFPRLDVPEDKGDGKNVVIRFAEAEPFAFIYRHWVAKRPYTCIADAENEVECPLCAAGHKAKPVVFYNVITTSDAVLRVWEMTGEPTSKVQKQYDKLAGQEKTLDDPGLYFVVSKTKKDNNFFEYDVEKVRATDLREETGSDPLDDDEIAHALRRGLFTDEIVQVSNKSDLRDAVDKLDDED